MKYVVLNNEILNDNAAFKDAIQTALDEGIYKTFYLGRTAEEKATLEYYLAMPDMHRFKMVDVDQVDVIVVTTEHEHLFDDFIIALQYHNGASNILDNAIEYQGSDADEVYSYLSDLKASGEPLFKNLDTVAKIELETVLTRKVLRMVIDGKF